MLARQVDATELGDRIIAVLEEYSCVQLFGSFESDGGVNGDVALDVKVTDELVEK